MWFPQARNTQTAVQRSRLEADSILPEDSCSNYWCNASFVQNKAFLHKWGLTPGYFIIFNKRNNLIFFSSLWLHLHQSMNSNNKWSLPAGERTMQLLSELIQLSFLTSQTSILGSLAHSPSDQLVGKKILKQSIYLCYLIAVNACVSSQKLQPFS